MSRLLLFSNLEGGKILEPVQSGVAIANYDVRGVNIGHKLLPQTWRKSRERIFREKKRGGSNIVACLLS
jgi:hypothetical protein